MIVRCNPAQKSRSERLQQHPTLRTCKEVSVCPWGVVHPHQNADPLMPKEDVVSMYGIATLYAVPRMPLPRLPSVAVFALKRREPDSPMYVQPQPLGPYCAPARPRQRNASMRLPATWGYGDGKAVAVMPMPTGPRQPVPNGAGQARSITHTSPPSSRLGRRREAACDLRGHCRRTRIECKGPQVHIQGICMSRRGHRSVLPM
jgi:hypothetical protein